MKVKSFFSDFLGFGLVSFFTRGVALLVLPVLTRSLDPSDYGIFELLIGISSIISVIVLIQLESYLARLWGDLDNTEKKSNVLSTLLITIILFGGILFFITFLIKDFVAINLFGSLIYGNLILLIFVSAYFLALAGLPLMALRMERRIIPFFIVQAVQSFLYLIVIYWMFYINNLRLDNVILITSLSSIVSFCMAIYFVSRYIKIKFDYRILKPAFRYGIPLVPAVAVTWINTQVDKYALLYFFDTKTVGEFSVILKIATVITIAVMIFRQAWLPYAYSLARRSDGGVKQFKQILLIYYVIGLSISFFIVLFSNYIFEFFVPSNYNLEYKILPVLLLASIVYGSASIVNIGTMVSGKTEWNSYASLIGVFLNILLTIILIPKFGIIGAAWGTLLSSYVFMLILSFQSNKLLAIDFQQIQIFILSVVFLLLSLIVL